MERPLSPEQLMLAMGANAVLFAVVALVFWGVEAVWKRRAARFPHRVSRWTADAAARSGRREARSAGQTLLFVLRHLPWMVAATIALEAGASFAARKFGWELPPQDMLTWLSGDTYSAKVKAAIIAYAVVVAPIVEELVFRRFVFRALLWFVPFGAAFAASGALFALVHFNALAFIPLAFLGAAFAWLYARTGRIIAPMFAHCLFNSLNVVILFTFPELA